MGWGRLEFDAENDELDRDDQTVSRLVAEGMLNGFQALKLGRAIELRRQALKGRLFSIAQRIGDKSKDARKNFEKFKKSEREVDVNA